MAGRYTVPRMPGYQHTDRVASAHALMASVLPHGKGLRDEREAAERRSADDVTMSGRAEWWAQEVALERVVVADDERERQARRRAARLAASEEQERRVRHHEITRAMDMVERMEEREIAVRMEEAERRRRIKEIDDAQQAALLEQHLQRSSALHSIAVERDRILSAGTATGGGGAAACAGPIVTLAMEREVQRRTAAQMLLSADASGATGDDGTRVSSAQLLQAILHGALPICTRARARTHTHTHARTHTNRRFFKVLCPSKQTRLVLKTARLRP